MDLRTYLERVARNYRRTDGLNTPTHALLKNADTELAPYAPAGIQIIGSGGKGLATYTPWVGFFDPDETTKPQEGIYVVYLFAEDLATITLTLNQGMEHLRQTLGDAGARERLRNDAAQIRAELPGHALAGLLPTIDLASRGARQRAYQAGNIIGRRYLTTELPDDTTLARDLRTFLTLYAQAIEAKNRLLLAKPGSIGSPSGSSPGTTTDPLRDFKPKDDRDYVAFLAGRAIIKSRRHETLLHAYADWASRRGFELSTEHPTDLIIRNRLHEWIVEAKVVRLGNATEAVRGALGQLLAYQHFLYAPRTRLLALFTEDIGAAYAAFLTACGVEAVWSDEGDWVGTPGATAAGLAERTD